jgi:hypothetical protein
MYSIQRPKLSTDPKYVEPGLGLPYLKMAATEDQKDPFVVGASPAALRTWLSYCAPVDVQCSWVLDRDNRTV